MWLVRVLASAAALASATSACGVRRSTPACHVVVNVSVASFRHFCALAVLPPFRLASRSTQPPHMHVRKKYNTRTGAALYLSHSIESHCATIFWNSPNSTPLSAPSSLANFASTALHCSSVGFWPAFWSADFSSFVSM